MLKMGGPQFHITLMMLFNTILKTAVWPFANNVIIFLKKPGKKDYMQTSSYRPITITSMCGKLLERIIETRLKAIAEQQCWIPEYQHGFRRDHSTLTYLTPMITKLQHQKA
jgi:hypothetical protein